MHTHTLTDSGRRFGSQIRDSIAPINQSCEKVDEDRDFGCYGGDEFLVFADLFGGNKVCSGYPNLYGL